MKLSLHKKIRTDFEDDILSGRRAPGDRLPTEKELMEQYDCSRMTVNKALSALVSAGLIDRRKKAGTFVSSPRVHSMILDIPDLPAQLSDQGHVHAYTPHLTRVRAPDTRMEPETWLSKGADDLLQLDGVHLADDRPIAYEHRLISARSVPSALDVDFSAITPGSWLLQNVPWTEAETKISACGLSGLEADLLKQKPGTPCLCIERRTWRASDPITYVRQVFLSDAYDLVARFGPTSSS